MGVALTLCVIGCALISDWQAIKHDGKPCTSFNGSSDQYVDIFGEEEANQSSLCQLLQKECEAQSTSSHQCFWNSQSRVTGEYCDTCLRTCLSEQTSLNFYQFNVGVILGVVGSRIAYIFNLALISDFVSVEKQVRILCILYACNDDETLKEEGHECIPPHHFALGDNAPTQYWSLTGLYIAPHLQFNNAYSVYAYIDMVAILWPRNHGGLCGMADH